MDKTIPAVFSTVEIPRMLSGHREVEFPDLNISHLFSETPADKSVRLLRAAARPVLPVNRFDARAKIRCGLTDQMKPG